MLKVGDPDWEAVDWELAKASNSARLVSRIVEDEWLAWTRGAKRVPDEAYAGQPWFVPAVTHAVEHVDELVGKAIDAQDSLPPEQRADAIEELLRDAWSMCSAFAYLGDHQDVDTVLETLRANLHPIADLLEKADWVMVCPLKDAEMAATDRMVELDDDGRDEFREQFRVVRYTFTRALRRREYYKDKDTPAVSDLRQWCAFPPTHPNCR